MSYVIFARKFRPQTFEEVVGQDPIMVTLKNAIKQKRIPQSFLFSGPRGIGKTSTARILAKALNCVKGPAPEPCGKCASCIEITQTNSMDVLEIDGASNRGIDEIRNLRETVKFKPATGRYKIYIIDEVHMLTTEAFNALLKTLEEPPEHVKFVFATTESHKMPLTILSRCQRFNFKRISTQEIAQKLEEIATAEKLKFDQRALYQIAKISDGALRDGESLLDQLASFSEKKISEEDVLKALGLASEEVYFSVVSALVKKDIAGIFRLVEELYDGGRDLAQFAKGLLEVFRNLLLVQCSTEIDAFVEMSEEGLKELKKKKDDFSRGELLLALSLLERLQGQLRRNLASPRLLIETMLLKLLHIDGFESLESGPVTPQSNRERPARPAAAGPGPAIKAPLATSRPEKSSPRAEVQAPRTPEVSQAVAAPAATAATAVSEGDLGLGQVEAAWSKAIDYVKTKRMSTGIFLSESEPIEVDGTVITLGLPAEFKFHKEMLEKESNRKLIEEALEVVLGAKVRVQLVVTKVDQREASEKESEPEPEPDKSDLPEIITQALDIFEGAKIVRKES